MTLTLPQKTFTGAILGILAGIIFGQYCGYLRPIGSLYVLLLQVAVYPYVISSLLRSLGSLVPSVGLNLLKRGWGLYILLMLVTFMVMIILANAIPVSQSSISIGNEVHKPVITTLLNLLVPSNPFAALSQNYVPAIIIFCIFYGVMIQHVAKKAAFIEMLDTITHASLGFWNKLVLVAPYAVFALFADAAGTINFLELKELSVYLAVFFIGTLLLAFWIIPALISSLTTLHRKDIFAGLREGLLLSISTTLSVVALPAIQEFVHKLVQSDENDPEETDEIVRTVSSVSYAFAQLGNCFLYLFVIFAAFYLAHPLDTGQKLLLPIMSYLSSIGSPSATVNSIAFLGSWLNLPDSVTELYVSTITLTRYGQVIASVMGIAALTILMTLSYYRKLKIQPRKLVINLILVLIVLGSISYAGRLIQPLLFSNVGANFNNFQLAPNITADIKTTVIRPDNNMPLSNEANTNEDSLLRVQRTHILRVGYNPTVVPFVYFNKNGELVGYDVAMIYNLARSLHSQIEFIPFSWNNLISDLNNNKFDIAIGGIYASQDRLAQAGLSDPYFTSPLALIVPEAKKNDYTQIKSDNELKVGIFADPILTPLVQHYFSHSQTVVVPDYTQLDQQMAQQQIDVALWTKEQAQAWVMLHPGYAAIVPHRLTFEPALAFAYLTAKNSPQFLNYLNYWLKLRTLDGFEQQQYQQWLLAKSPTVTQHRWNIIDDVLLRKF